MIPAVASGAASAAAAEATGVAPELAAVATAGGNAALELVQLMVYQLSAEASAQLVEERLATLGRFIDVRA